MHFGIKFKRTISLLIAFVFTLNILWTSTVFADEDQLNYEQIKQQTSGNEELTKKYPNGLFAFMSTNFKVGENDKPFKVVVLRMGGSTGRATVKFKAFDITATYEEDYYISVKDGWSSEVLTVKEGVDAEASGESGTEEVNDVNENQEGAQKAQASGESGTEEVNGVNENQEGEQKAQDAEASSESGTEVVNDVNENQEGAQKAQDAEASSESGTEVVNDVNENQEGSQGTGDTIDDTTSNTSSDDSLNVLPASSKNKARLQQGKDKFFGYEKNNFATASQNDVVQDEEQLKQMNELYGQKINGAEHELVFEDGEFYKELTITLLDDTIPEDPEQLMLLLYDATGGAEVEPNISNTVEIVDNEPYNTPEISLASTHVQVVKGQASAKVELIRNTEIYRYSTLKVATYDITAKAGEDFQDVNTTVLFMPGQKTATVEIPLYNNPLNKEKSIQFGIGIIDPISASIKGSTRGIVEIVSNTEEVLPASMYAKSTITPFAVALDAATTRLTPQDDFEEGYIGPNAKVGISTDAVHMYSQKGNAWAVGATKDKIDFTGIKTMKYSWINTGTDNGKNNISWLTITDNKSGNAADETYMNKKRVGAFDEEDSVDVSSITGAHYIKVATQNFNGNIAELRLRYIELVKQSYGIIVEAPPQESYQTYTAAGQSTNTMILPGSMSTSGKTKAYRDEEVTFIISPTAGFTSQGIQIKDTAGEWKDLSDAIRLSNNAYSLELTSAWLQKAIDNKWISSQNGLTVRPKLVRGENSFSVVNQTGGTINNFIAGTTYNYKQGDKVSISSTPDSGYSVGMYIIHQLINGSWSRSEVKATDTILTLQGTETKIEAIFQESENQLKVNQVSGNGTGTVISSLQQNVSVGQEVVLKASANEGSRAVWWVTEGQEYYGDTFIYKVPANKSTVNVSFEKANTQTNKITGTIMLDNVSLYNKMHNTTNTDTPYVPAKGAVVEISGNSAEVDANGNFSLDLPKSVLNEKRFATITYKGATYTKDIVVGNPVYAQLSLLDKVDLYSFEAIMSGTKLEQNIFTANKPVTLSVRAISKDLPINQAIFRAYDNKGIMKWDATVVPESDVLSIILNAFNYFEGVDRLTVEFATSNGSIIGEVDTGYSFLPQQNLGTELKMFTIKPSENSDSVDIPLLGALSPAIDSGYFNVSVEVDPTDGNISVNIGANAAAMIKEAKSKEKSYSELKQEQQNMKSVTDKLNAAKAANSTSSQNNNTKALDGAKISLKDESSAGINMNLDMGITIDLALMAKTDESTGDKTYFYIVDKLYLYATTGSAVGGTYYAVIPVVFIPVYLYYELEGVGTLTAVATTSGNNQLENEKVEDLSKINYDNLKWFGEVNINTGFTISAGAGIKGAISGDINQSGEIETSLVLLKEKGSGTISFTTFLKFEFLYFEFSWKIINKDVELFNYNNMAGKSFNFTSSITDVDSSEVQTSDREYLNTTASQQSSTAQLFAAGNLAQDTVIQSSGTYPGAEPQIIKVSENMTVTVFLADLGSRNDLNKTEIMYTVGIRYSNGVWNYTLPKRVVNDSTPDFYPTLFNVGDKVLLTWSSPAEEWTKNESIFALNSTEIYTAFFNPETKSFEAPMQVTNDAMTINYYNNIGDASWEGATGFGDSRPQVAYDADSNTLAFFYIKTEYDMCYYQLDVKGQLVKLENEYGYPRTPTEEELAAAGNIVNVPEGDNYIVYRLYDMNTNTWVTDYSGIDLPNQFDEDEASAWYGQRFLELGLTDENGNDLLNNPKVEQISATACNGEALISYTLDLDGDQTTTQDQELFMQAYNFITKKVSHPIRISNNNVQDYNAQFAAYKNNVYLFWAQAGKLVYYDVRELLSTYMGKTTASDGRPLYELKEYVDKTYLGENGSAVTIKEVVEPTKATLEENYQAADNYEVSVSENGYICILWTEKEIATERKFENEEIPEESFYAVLYDPKGQESKIIELNCANTDSGHVHDATCPTKETTTYSGTWSLKNRIETDMYKGKVNMSQSFVVFDNGEVHTAQMRLNKQRVDANGKVLSPSEKVTGTDNYVKWLPDESTRKLIISSFNKYSTLELKSENIMFSNSCANPGDTIRITATAKNPGFQSTGRVTFTFYEVLKDGTQNQIGTYTSADKLSAGYEVDGFVDYTVSEDLDKISVSAVEADKSVSDALWANKSLEKMPLYSIQSVRSKVLQPDLAQRDKLGLKTGDMMYEVTTTIQNVGNMPSGNASMKVFLYNPDAYSDETGTESFTLDLLTESLVLQPKETKTMTKTVIVTKEQISKAAATSVNKKVELGVTAEETKVLDSNKLLISDSQSTYVAIDSNQLEDIQITQNGNAVSDLEMMEGQSIVLKGQILPEQSSSKNILTWESSNPQNVSLSITSEGEYILHANNEGTATITVTAAPYGYKKQLQISVTDVPGASTMSVSALTAFASQTAGYSAAPAAQTVTITNTGSEVITLTPPTATNYTIGALSTTNLAVSGTATFTVQPKTGLAVGVYNETIYITGSSEASASVSAQFTVTAAAPESSSGGNNPPAPVTRIDNGGSTTSDNLKQLVSGSKTLTVDGDKGAKLVFDTEALKGIVSQTTSDIKVEMKDVSPAHQENLPGKRVFALTVSSGSTTISNFGGAVTASLPYELKEGERAQDVTVWYLESDGTMTEIPCTYDPATKLATFTVTHFSLYVVGVAGTEPWVNPFSDVSKGDWFYGAVEFANRNGLFAGTGVDTFSPNSLMTRAMLWTVLGRLDGQSLSGSGVFDAARIWAMGAGITDGTNPDGNITREQMVTILWRYAGSPKAGGELSKFSDAGSVASYAAEAMAWAVEKGILTGANGALIPKDNATRAQVAAILERFIKEVTK